MRAESLPLFRLMLLSAYNVKISLK